MAKKKTEVVATEEVVAVAGEATVTWQGQSRTYTKEIHGADYAKLAKSFAEKVGGEVV